MNELGREVANGRSDGSVLTHGVVTSSVIIMLVSQISPIVVRLLSSDIDCKGREVTEMKALPIGLLTTEEFVLLLDL